MTCPLTNLASGLTDYDVALNIEISTHDVIHPRIGALHKILYMLVLDYNAKVARIA